MSEELVIRDIMSKPVTIAKSAAITEALDKMLAESVDPLIVVNNGSVVRDHIKKDNCGEPREQEEFCTFPFFNPCIELDGRGLYYRIS